jgi:hypothetical protein
MFEVTGCGKMPVLYREITGPIACCDTMQVTVPSIWSESRGAIYLRVCAYRHRGRPGGALRVHVKHDCYQLCVAGQDAHAE